MNFIQTMLPFLVAGGLSVSRGAFLVSAFTLTSSLLQPVAGYLADQKNLRWMIYLGTLWMAALLSLLGLIKNYPLSLALVTLAGLGTAAFHPQASAMVSAASGKRKGLFQALFVTSGNIGFALTPLLMVPAVLRWGTGAWPLFFLPGLAAGVLAWMATPRLPAGPKAPPLPLREAVRGVWGSLALVVLVVATRSLAYFGLVSFLPLYLQDQNVSLAAGGRLLFLMLFSGALGGLAGGHLSDIFGRRPVIAGSLLLATPFFYLFLHSNGAPGYIFLALGGAFLMASFSVTVVMAQEMLSKNSAIASGLMLGFGIGTGGLGVGLLGILSEYMRIGFVVNLIIFLPLLAGILALAIKSGAGRPAAGEAPR